MTEWLSAMIWVAHGIVVARALPVVAEAGVEPRLPALWYVEFVPLRFQDDRDEYPSANRAGDAGDVAPVRVGGDVRLGPSNRAHARTGVKRPETLYVAPPSGDDIAVVPHV